jgi:hypothetical protein
VAFQEILLKVFSNSISTELSMITFPRKKGTQQLILSRKSLLVIGLSVLGGTLSPVSAAPITHYFTINPIRICNTAATTCAPTPFFPNETYKIYSQVGVAPIFLPIKQINNSSLLTVNGVANVSVPGNGQHPNPTTINAWFANSLNSAPGSVLYGEAWLGGNGLVINGSAVQSFPPSGRKDTFAHEVGHNLGLGHSDFGAGAGNNLMTAGSSRLIPGGVGDITPDGATLSQLTASQKTKLLASPFLAPVPDVLIDTRGSTPFDSNDFFLVKFNSGGASNVFLKSLKVDLTPVNAFFDSTNISPGNSSSPLAISAADLIGLSASDITLAGGNAALNGQQSMTLTFADNAFKAGDSFRFGVDIDLFSGIDNFGATPSELIGSLFSFVFSDGFAVQSALDADLTASSTLPNGLPTFVGDPSGGVNVSPGTITDDPDPVPTNGLVPTPAPLPVLGVLSALRCARTLRKRTEIARL